MAKYDYECPFGCIVEDERSLRDDFKPTILCPSHKTAAVWKPSVFRAVFQPTIGRDSGFYDLDYGKRATEDLTARKGAKFARLIKEGRIGDPFSEFESEVRSGKRERYRPQVQKEDPLEG